MEDAVPVHVVHGLEQLVHVVLHGLLGKVLRAALDELVDVALHELKHERQAARGLIIQHLVQLDDVVVRRQAAQRLDLAEVVHLLQVLKHCENKAREWGKGRGRELRQGPHRASCT